MKKSILLVLFNLITIAFVHAGVYVSEKVLKIFQETFKEAKEVEWYVNSSDKKYVVCFQKDDVRYNVTYDIDGRFLNSKRYYTEEKLPLDVLVALKNKFKSRQIYGVTELMNEDGLVYHVRMTDQKYFWMVKVSCAQIMVTTEKFKKQ